MDVMCNTDIYKGKDGAFAFLVHINQGLDHSIFMSRYARLGFASWHTTKAKAWTT